MKRGRFLIGAVGLVQFVSLLTFIFVVPDVSAEASPAISISRFRVSTGGQFFELHTDQAVPDMSRVQLVYYNHYDLSKVTSSKIVSLTGSLPEQGYFLVNDSALTMCYQMTIATASLGFSTTAGMVQVILLNQAEMGGQFTSTVLDSVAWSKTAVAGSPEVQKLPVANPASFLQKDDEAWREYWPSATDPCAYETSTGVVEADDNYVFLSGAMPPVRYVAAVSENTGKVNRNVGKAAPIINEILPNPASPQTDADDEFVELYNPNDTVFDLSGFKLAFGGTSPKKYTFPEGTLLQPKAFKAFTSADTSISLSNTEAQVWLLDPNEQVINQSEPYMSAKDGQAWALDNGKWVWTAVSTPNELNALSGTTTTGSTKTVAAVLGINKSTTGSTGTASGSVAPNGTELDDAAPLHPGVLAGVGVAAVAYAMYEYRQDMSNRLFQLRRYLRNRRAVR